MVYIFSIFMGADLYSLYSYFISFSAPFLVVSFSLSAVRVAHLAQQVFSLISVGEGPCPDLSAGLLVLSLLPPPCFYSECTWWLLPSVQPKSFPSLAPDSHHYASRHTHRTLFPCWWTRVSIQSIRHLHILDNGAGGWICWTLWSRLGRFPVCDNVFCRLVSNPWFLSLTLSCSRQKRTESQSFWMNPVKSEFGKFDFCLVMSPLFFVNYIHNWL